jgi:hypothetical protein
VSQKENSKYTFFLSEFNFFYNDFLSEFFNLNYIKNKIIKFDQHILMNLVQNLDNITSIFYPTFSYI